MQTSIGVIEWKSSTHNWVRSIQDAVTVDKYDADNIITADDILIIHSHLKRILLQHKQVWYTETKVAVSHWVTCSWYNLGAKLRVVKLQYHIRIGKARGAIHDR